MATLTKSSSEQHRLDAGEVTLLKDSGVWYSILPFGAGYAA